MTSLNYTLKTFLIVGSFVTGIFSTTTLTAQVPATPGSDDPVRHEAVEPFHIIDNVYFIGKTSHNPSYLFTSNEGHIIMDSTYEEFVPDIETNIEKLGFNIGDVKIILSSHAHHDHVGGHALLREITGAKVMASKADAEIIETGGIADFREGDPWHEGEVDELITDQQVVTLGDIALQAHFTPGHTKGCTTWTTTVEDNGRQYDLVLLCGLRMDQRSPLVGHPEYPDMPKDFAYSFAVAKTLPVDVFLGAHGYWFNLRDKMEKLRNNPEVNPFINPEEYYRIVEGWEKLFLDRLNRERQSILSGNE